jgi:hypothetical protein
MKLSARRLGGARTGDLCGAADSVWWRTADPIISVVLDRFGRVDIPINNAGAFVSKPFTGWGAEDEGTVGLAANLGPEAVADPFEYCPQQLAVGGAGVVQPHLPGLHRHHVQGGERAGICR